MGRARPAEPGRGSDRTPLHPPAVRKPVGAPRDCDPCAAGPTRRRSIQASPESALKCKTCSRGGSALICEQAEEARRRDGLGRGMPGLGPARGTAAAEKQKRERYLTAPWVPTPTIGSRDRAIAAGWRWRELCDCSARVALAGPAWTLRARARSWSRQASHRRQAPGCGVIRLTAGQDWRRASATNLLTAAGPASRSAAAACETSQCTCDTSSQPSPVQPGA